VRIAFSAVRLAVVGFLLPFAFVWNPAILLMSDPLTNVIAVVGAVFAMLAIACSVEGMLARSLNHIERILLLLAGAAAVSPQPLLVGAGVLVIIAVFARHVLLAPKAATGNNA